jgi:hypothetical protein
MNSAIARTSDRASCNIPSIVPSSAHAPSAWEAMIVSWTRYNLDFQQMWLDAIASSASRSLEVWNAVASLSSAPFKFSPSNWIYEAVETNLGLQAILLKLLTREANIVATQLTEAVNEAERFVSAMDVVVETPRELMEPSPIKPSHTTLAKAAG